MLNVENIVFSRVKHDVNAKLKTKYPNLAFTTSDKVIKDAKFPAVYVHLLPALEMGQDIEGKTINAGMFTFQIDVSDNQSQNRAKKVMDEIVASMKSMRFELVAFPEFQNSDSAFRSVARFRRVIGAGETL